MPKIPTIESQVRAQVAPAQMRSGDIPDAAGAFAAGMRQAGGALFDVAQREIQEVQRTQYEGALYRLLTLDGQIETKATNTKGEAFITPKDGELPMDRMLIDRDKQVQEIVKELPDRVKRQVLTAATRSKVTLERSLGHHLVAQGDMVRDSRTKSLVDGFVTYTASHPYNEAGFTDRLGAASASLEASLRAKGEPEDVIRQKIGTLVAEGLVTRTQAMLEAKDITGAKAMMDKHTEAMSASAKFGPLKQAFDARERTTSAVAFVDLHWKPGASITEFGDRIRESFADPETRRLARAEWTEREQEYRTQKQTLATNFEASIWDAERKGVKTSELLTMIAGTSDLDGTQKSALQGRVEARRNGTAEERADIRFRNILPYLVAPEKVAKMTPNELLALTPKIGPGGVRELYEMQKSLQRNGGSTFPYTIDSATVNGVRAALKLDGKGHDDVVAPALMKANQQVDAEQKATGKQLDPKRKEQILRDQLRPVQVQVPRTGFTGWVMGGGATVQTKRMSEVENPRDIIDAHPVLKVRAAEDRYRREMGLGPMAPVPDWDLAQLLTLEEGK